MCKSTDSGDWRRTGSEEGKRLGAVLHERGFHVTAQREAVFEVVSGCPGHICAEHVLAKVVERWDGLGMNKSTVYRILNLLLELGLVSEHKCVDGSAQYEPASRGPHSHLVCRRCGTMYDLDVALEREMHVEMLARHGFDADLQNYPILGLCGACCEPRHPEDSRN